MIVRLLRLYNNTPWDFFYVNSIGIPLSIKFFLLMIMNKCVEFALLLFHNALSAES